MGEPANEPLRCEDVSRAISANVAGEDLPALAGHLAACHRCASWAEQNAALNMLWDASRPIEPSESVWDSTWTKISAELDRAIEPAIIPVSAASRWWMRGSVARTLLTQAAALFLAVGLLWTRPWQTPLDVANPESVAQATRSEVEIPEGQFALFPLDGRKTTLHTIEIAQIVGANSLDSSYAFLGELESRAE